MLRANKLGCHKAPALMGEETPICSPVRGRVGDEVLFTEQSGGKEIHILCTRVLDP